MGSSMSLDIVFIYVTLVPKLGFNDPNRLPLPIVCAEREEKSPID